MTPDQILAMSTSTLAELDSAELFQLKADAADLLSLTRAIVAHIDHALELKYADRAKAMLEAAGKDAGVVHFDDGAVRITAAMPKVVEWNQARLADVVRRISKHGGDPFDYVDAYIPETRYTAWSEPLQSAFAQARIVKPGKPQFRLALIGEHDES